jgi:uncharacterized protein (DUF1330 family)
VPAYIVVETDIHDAEQYKQASPAAVEAEGGRFIARGGDVAIWRAIGNPSA